MTVKELRNALKEFDDDMEVMTKKTEFFGNVAYINSIKQDSYASFGVDIPCVLLTDEYETENEEEGIDD